MRINDAIKTFTILSVCTLSACGGSGSSNNSPIVTPPTSPPTNNASTLTASAKHNGMNSLTIMSGGNGVDGIIETQCAANFGSIEWTFVADNNSPDVNLVIDNKDAGTTTVTASGDNAGKAILTCTSTTNSALTKSFTVYVRTPSDRGVGRANPLRFDADSNLQISSSFILTANTPPSTDINECFGVDAADLETVACWRSDSTEHGNYAAIVIDYPHATTNTAITDDDPNVEQFIKMYYLPNTFIIALSPYAVAPFGDMVIEVGMQFKLPVRQATSDNDIIVGGLLSDGGSVLENQFGQTINGKIVEIIVTSIDKSINITAGAYSGQMYNDCVSFASQVHGLNLDFTERETVYCEVEPNKFALVSWDETTTPKLFPTE